jgi:hypothetical protein
MQKKIYTKKIIYHRIWNKIKTNETNQWIIEPKIRDVRTGDGKFKCICGTPFEVKTNEVYDIIKNKYNNKESAITPNCKCIFYEKKQYSEVIICEDDKNLHNKTKEDIYYLILSYNKIYHPPQLKNYTIDELVNEYKRSTECIFILDQINNKKKQFENYLNKKNMSHNCYIQLENNKIKYSNNHFYKNKTFKKLFENNYWLDLIEKYKGGIESTSNNADFINEFRLFKIYYVSLKIKELNKIIEDLKNTKINDEKIKRITFILDSYLSL